MEYLIAAAIWILTGALAWRIQYNRSTMKTSFDALMIGPCMILGPICLILILRHDHV